MTPERARELAYQAWGAWMETDHDDHVADALTKAILQACAEQDAARKGRGDPNGNWLMKPSLDWLENAEHGENQARCRMIAEILRDLWRGDDTLGAMPVAIGAAIKEGK